jgi:hypothetical protein
MKSGRMRWWCMYHILGEKRHFYMVSVVKTKGKRPLGKLVHGSEGNMKTDLKEIRWEDMDRIYPAEDKDKWQTLTRDSGTSGFIHCREFLDSLRDYNVILSSKAVLHLVN